MKTRTDLLNHLVEKYNLQRYLEIGVQVPELNFDRIKVPYKIGVDPDPDAHATFCMTSDDFFQNYGINYPGNKRDIAITDLVFIDGLHTAEQVKKDFENALKVLSPNGFIVLHDCNPLKEEHTIVPRPTKTGHWNGDVWKFAITITNQTKATVDIDNGCLVYSPRGVPKIRQTFITKDCSYFIGDMNVYVEIQQPKWEFFDANRKELLNLISWNRFMKNL